MNAPDQLGLFGPGPAPEPEQVEPPGDGHAFAWERPDPYPEPTHPAPPTLLGGKRWKWNPRVGRWQMHFLRPPISIEPTGIERTGDFLRLSPPPGYLRFRLKTRTRQGTTVGLCPHCGAEAANGFSGRGWSGYADPKVRAAIDAEEAAGRQVYGGTMLAVEGYAAPISSNTGRYSAGYCSACGCIEWRDFSPAEGRQYGGPEYFHPPTQGAPAPDDEPYWLTEED